MDNGRKTTVVLDSSHHGFRMLAVCRKEDTEEEAFQMWKYKYLNGIFQYIDKFNADEFIIALDSRKNWRKKVFPYYKGVRKIKRDADESADEGWFCFQNYFDMYEKFMEDLTSNLPFKSLEIEFAEADDIAGVLCTHEKLKGHNKIFVTVDQDYIQLMQNPLTKIYNPMKHEFMKSDNPKHDLLKKIVLGDKGDHVPSIQDKHKFKPEFLEYCINEGIAKNESNAKIKLENDEDLLLTHELEFMRKYGIKPSRVTKFSAKLANSLIEDNKLMEHLATDPELKRKFLRNNKIVNLTSQPKEIKAKILEEYDNTEIKAGLKNLFDFFIKHNFNEFMEETVRIGDILEPLCD